MNASLPARHIQRRVTPWPIRTFIVVAILFGIWVDVSSVEPYSDVPITTDSRGTRLIGLSGENSFAANIVRTLASRR